MLAGEGSGDWPSPGMFFGYR